MFPNDFQVKWVLMKSIDVMELNRNESNLISNFGGIIYEQISYN